jgi:hypothetical protein
MISPERRLPDIQSGGLTMYQTETTKRTETPGTAGGYVRTLTSIRNSEVTRTIPARPGVRFGFRYNVVGAPDGAQVPISIVDKFPERGLRKKRKARCGAIT